MFIFVQDSFAFQISSPPKSIITYFPITHVLLPTYTLPAFSLPKTTDNLPTFFVPLKRV